MPDFGLGLFVPHRRSIGGIIADVTVEENERDDVTVTEHPVEQGAPISDHAFKRPEEVILRVGWTVQKSGDLSAESGVYGILLNWQASFVPFDLYTGKRSHRNMLITGIAVTTDEHSEYSLMATVICREIILTKSSSVAQTSGMSSNAADHADPETTGPTVNSGEQQLEISGTGGTGTSLNNVLGVDVPSSAALDKGITIIEPPPQLVAP